MLKIEKTSYCLRFWERRSKGEHDLEGRWGLVLNLQVLKIARVVG